MYVLDKSSRLVFFCNSAINVHRVQDRSICKPYNRIRSGPCELPQMILVIESSETPKSYLDRSDQVNCSVHVFHLTKYQIYSLQPFFKNEYLKKA